MSPVRRSVTVAASIGTAVMVVGLLLILVVRDGTEIVQTAPQADVILTEPTAGAPEEEILLEPVSFTGADPFTGSVAQGPSVPGPIVPGTTERETFQLPPAPGNSTPTVRGGEVGLFGGSLRYGSCHREKLVRFLERNPDKAAAWVAALNSDPTLRWSGGNKVRVDQIREYVFELTPMILRTDTRVTNHGYRNGRPYRIQSVLQAGTAVLVDYYGVPRVKCYCGNPLLPPYSYPRVYKGDKWDDFDEDDIGYVSPATTIIDVFVLEDVETGQLFRRPAGTAGAADLAGLRNQPPPPPGPPTSYPTGYPTTQPSHTPSEYPTDESTDCCPTDEPTDHQPEDPPEEVPGHEPRRR
jgi:hypothetical protein